MIGKYYRTIERDEATGDTLFELSLLEFSPYAVNGLLKCKGKIEVLAFGIPIDIEGEFHFPYFVVKDYTLFSKTSQNAEIMLDYLYEDLSESQKKIIMGHINNDILQLVENPSILDDALKRSKNKDQIKKEILQKLKRICEQSVLTRSLIKYNVELNKIEMLCRHNISYEQFKKQPYLCSLYHDISVYQADLFAFEKINILPYNPVRLCGFMMDVLQLYKKSGHVCVKPKDLLNCINAKLKKSVYPEYEINMALLNYCISISSNYVNYHTVDDEIYVYENSVWEQEEQIVMDIHRLNNNPTKLVQSPNISKIEMKLGITYNQKQKEAFNLLNTTGIKILTGPPGAGKTSTLEGLIEAYKDAYPNRIVKLAATTGRAAQVMMESTGKEAETINKMVDVRPFGDKYQGRGPNNPIEADFIICDEISMLGTELASFLFRAIKSGTLLLLVGDEDQLQSVEYGNILQDLISSGVIDVYRLTEIMRNSGAICENGQRINRGNKNLVEDQTFFIHDCTEEDVSNILLTELQKDNVQVLSSVKKGNLGIYNINQIIQKRKNARKKLCLRYRQVEYYENDPIIMTKTNYTKGYFNSDIGYVKSHDTKGIIVDFNGKIIHLDQSDYHLMMLAYCITTHKSQGSSFENVHIVLPRNPENMLTRRILYTAVTRARKTVHIYNVKNAVEYAISNKAESKRLSLLSKKLNSQEKEK